MISTLVELAYGINLEVENVKASLGLPTQVRSSFTTQVVTSILFNFSQINFEWNNANIYKKEIFDPPSNDDSLSVTHISKRVGYTIYLDKATQFNTLLAHSPTSAT